MADAQKSTLTVLAVHGVGSFDRPKVSKDLNNAASQIFGGAIVPEVFDWNRLVGNQTGRRSRILTALAKLPYLPGVHLTFPIWHLLHVLLFAVGTALPLAAALALVVLILPTGGLYFSALLPLAIITPPFAFLGFGFWFLSTAPSRLHRRYRHPTLRRLLMRGIHVVRKALLMFLHGFLATAISRTSLTYWPGLLLGSLI